MSNYSDGFRLDVIIYAYVVCNAKKKDSSHNCCLLKSLLTVCLLHFKDYICIFTIRLIVNCVSLYKASPAQSWVASWICELFNPPIRWVHGFPLCSRTSINNVYFCFVDISFLCWLFEIKSSIITTTTNTKTIISITTITTNTLMWKRN